MLVAIAVVVVIAAAAIGAWIIARDDGPVAAEDAQIEVTFTGEETSYSGDREIVAGTARISLFNETTELVEFAVFRYDPGSDELAAEPGGMQEGMRFVPGTHQVPESAIELVEWDIPPGSKTWTLELRPGIYFLDVGLGDAHFTGVWRAGIIEVVTD